MTTEMVGKINAIREGFLDLCRVLSGTASFRSLAGGSLKPEWDAARRAADLPTVKSPVAATYTCAVVGGSNNGKTTILNEMFPALAQRGWLVTEARDTTSQALRIAFAAAGSPKLDEVHLHSWEYSQIKALAEAARAENAADGVATRFDDAGRRVLIDGAAATFADAGQFHFAKTQALRPLPQSPVDISARAKTDQAFMTAVTVKEASAAAARGPVLTVGAEAFGPLELRAVIKQVDLHDPYRNVSAWAHGKGPAEGLVFLDTPGLGTGFSTNDEVLRHVLKRKNKQTVVELAKHDELDIVIHLVLATQLSTFSELWKAASEQCAADQLADLEDRLILAVNGFNKYLTDPNLVKNWDNPKGDHFTVTIEENVLKKMSEAGAVRPAKLCFLDSLAIVNAAGTDYAAFYAKHRPTLAGWCKPDAPCLKTLGRLGLATPDSFLRNINAVCDPADRGQGFLVRQVLDLVRESGAKLKVRKHLVRTRLGDAVAGLRAGLLRYYSEAGQLNFRLIREAIRGCLSAAGMSPADLGSIEAFVAAAGLDAKADAAVPAPGAAGTPERWVGQAYRGAATHLLAALKQTSQLAAAGWKHFEQYFWERYKLWERNAGSAAAVYPPPTPQRRVVADVVKHTIKLQIRDMLFQMLTDSAQEQGGNVSQDAADRAAVQDAIKRAAELLGAIDAACRESGVQR